MSSVLKTLITFTDGFKLLAQMWPRLIWISLVCSIDTLNTLSVTMTHKDLRVKFWFIFNYICRIKCKDYIFSALL